MNNIIDNLQNNSNEHESAEEELQDNKNNPVLDKLSKDIVQAVHIFKNWSQRQKEYTITHFISITKLLSIAEKLLKQ